MTHRSPGRGSLPRSALPTLIVAIVALAAALAVQASGVGFAIDRTLAALRFEMLSHPASGRLVIVEMDAASTGSIASWPWPRSNYAAVVDQLHRAGAASIVFDVDFSSAGDQAGDQAMAAAIARADGLVALPTFGQQARAADRRNLDALPLPLFRSHAALASVSIAPDDDGLVRHAPLGTVTADTPRPSLSAYLAHRSGRADEQFPIDFATVPDGIPRLSFVAVRDGRFDAALVRGRGVVIGATAIEMGDRYATPRWSNLPGVVIQALAAETLMSGTPYEASADWAIALALLLSLPILLVRRPLPMAICATIALAGLVMAVLAAQSAGIVVPLAGSLVLLAVTDIGWIVRDVLAHRRRQRLFDEESGLPNRRALLADGGARAGSEALLALVVGNYDSLAAVLPDGGDGQVMMRLAERLQLHMAGSTIYRIGDRALALAVPADDATASIQPLIPMLRKPIEVAGRRVDATISFGIGPASRNVERQLNAALLAAEQAAQSGAGWKIADADLGGIEQDVSLMGEMETALAERRLSVAYQPKLAIRDGRIAGAEALVRWRTPAGDFIPPSLFIPMAEKTDRVGPLTMFVLETVLADLAAWQAAGRSLVVAVNISARLLGDAGFVGEVERLLAAVKIDVGGLIFEVTESATLADPAAAVRSLVRFDQLGIALSMDDYGTGQSTLTYARELPLSELKIDRSFVQHAARDRRDAAMVRSTVDLAHELGLKVVAEGVEDEECLALLRSIGCDIAQGYLIGRPQPAAEFLAICDDDVRRSTGAAA
ncbi:putative bifunctional diguanylate cyclase/phosphodiesterase [Sphingomonas bacterium]|uniref:putative bifunctional diguanylate cyclase/phosphodiesterase n=1 Tax=Sphingomonas bacterium TaxID=1895847 RepID=UPI0015758D5B|nr:EAL domain-containing protein [Sphingomonas bacterium]